MKITKIVLFALLVIGLLDGAYLSIEHFYPGVLACPNTSVIDCTTVLTSSYSSVFGVPLAFFGLGWIIIMLGIAARKTRISAFLAPIWYIFGAFGIAYSLTAQYFIGKICIYCMTLDAVIMLVILIAIKLKLYEE